MKELSIEIPFGAKDSELCGWEYTIPEGMEATIVDNKIIVKKKESEEEKIRKDIVEAVELHKGFTQGRKEHIYAWLEKQSTPQVRTGLEWVNTIDDACDKRYSEEYAHGEYCHEQSFKWGFQEGVEWLEKQGGQKPAWSEEDKEKLDRIISLIHCYTGTVQEENELKTFLKSLKDRYFWKPSKEQMEAMQVFLEHGCAAPDREASLAEKFFELLYNDLKNL